MSGHQQFFAILRQQLNKFGPEYNQAFKANLQACERHLRSGGVHSSLMGRPIRALTETLLKRTGNFSPADRTAVLLQHLTFISSEAIKSLPGVVKLRMELTHIIADHLYDKQFDEVGLRFLLKAFLAVSERSEVFLSSCEFSIDRQLGNLIRLISLQHRWLLGYEMGLEGATLRQAVEPALLEQTRVFRELLPEVHEAYKPYVDRVNSLEKRISRRRDQERSHISVLRDVFDTATSVLGKRGAAGQPPAKRCHRDDEAANKLASFELALLNGLN